MNAWNAGGTCPVLSKHLRQVDEDGSIAFASFEARTGEESIAMALESRCLDLGDFLVDHFLRDGGFAELCFVECVALGVLRYHIEFAARFVCGVRRTSTCLWRRKPVRSCRSCSAARGIDGRSPRTYEERSFPRSLGRRDDHRRLPGRAADALRHCGKHSDSKRAKADPLQSSQTCACS